MHVLMAVNDTTFTYNLRKEILEKLLSDGHKVSLMCQVISYREEFEKMGVNVIDVKTDRRGTNPLSDIKLFFKYLRILKKERPDMVLTNNIKPNVYAGLACRMLKIKRIANITGLGTAVEHPGAMQKLSVFLYRMGVKNAECILFQNTENVQFFKSHNMISKKTRTVLLPGSGVNLEKHTAKPYPEGDEVHFLFIARIMKEKGIDLYLACAKEIHKKYPNTVFHICGMCDDTAYLETLKNAEQDGYIRYHGEQKNMVPFFEKAHCILHPSYYPEGMSNVLLEAAASARPIVATNRSGCRETVEDGKTGYIIPIKDEKALIEATEKFMRLTWEERKTMGLKGREMIEREFDRKIVVNMVADAVNSLG